MADSTTTTFTGHSRPPLASLVHFIINGSLPALLMATLLGFGGCGYSEGDERFPPGGIFDPVSVTADPQGRFVLVANGNFLLKYRAGTVVAIDTATNQLIEGAKVEVPSFAGRMEISPTGDFAWLTTRENDQIVTIGLDHSKMGQGKLTLDCGQGRGDGPGCSGDRLFNLRRHDRLGINLQEPFDLTVRPAPADILYPGGGQAEGGGGSGSGSDYSRLALWATYLNPGGVVVLPIKPEDGTPDVIDEPHTLASFVSRGTSTVAVSPCGTGAFAGNNQNHLAPYLELIRRPVTDAPETTEPFLLNPVNYSLVAEADGTQRWEMRSTVLDPDGEFLYVAMRDAMDRYGGEGFLQINQVVFLEDNLPELINIARIPLTGLPGKVVLSPDLPHLKRKIYVLVFESNTIEVIDPHTLTHEDIIQVGNGPFDMAFANTGEGLRGYVTAFRDGAVSVVDLEPSSETYNTTIQRVGGSK